MVYDPVGGTILKRTHLVSSNTEIQTYPDISLSDGFWGMWNSVPKTLLIQDITRKSLTGHLFQF